MKLKLLWEFYKSVIEINLVLIIISLLFNPSSIMVNLCLFAIPIIYFYKEYYRKSEYYFYYNCNISRLNLFTFCLSLNFIISTLILLILWILN
jgi:hypothetical protein